jgi:hypothetical protein
MRNIPVGCDEFGLKMLHRVTGRMAEIATGPLTLCVTSLLNSLIYLMCNFIRYGKNLWKVAECRGIITAPSHAKLKVQSPPPPTALLRMRGGTCMLAHVHLFVLPTVNRPYKLNIHTVLYCPPFCSVVLFMPPPHW